MPVQVLCVHAGQGGGQGRAGAEQVPGHFGRGKPRAARLPAGQDNGPEIGTIWMRYRFQPSLTAACDRTIASSHPPGVPEARPAKGAGGAPRCGAAGRRPQVDLLHQDGGHSPSVPADSRGDSDPAALYGDSVPMSGKESSVANVFIPTKDTIFVRPIGMRSRISHKHWQGRRRAVIWLQKSTATCRNSPARSLFIQPLMDKRKLPFVCRTRGMQCGEATARGRRSKSFVSRRHSLLPVRNAPGRHT